MRQHREREEGEGKGGRDTERESERERERLGASGESNYCGESEHKTESEIGAGCQPHPRAAITTHRAIRHMKPYTALLPLMTTDCPEW